MVPIRANRGPQRSQVWGDQPTSRAIKRFTVKLSLDKVTQPLQVDVLPTKSKFGGVPAHVLFKSVVASQFVKSLRKMGDAKRAFANVLADELDAGALERINVSKDHQYETLRKARTKWDICWNLAFRRFFATLFYSEVCISLFVDCSPQKRGLELFSASFDIGIRNFEKFARRMFPQVCIGISCTSLLGKVVTLLWDIFLIVGPDYNKIRCFLGCVFVILTDYGTEKGIVDYPDVLFEFMQAIGCLILNNAERRLFLFQNALHSPGWEHSIDGLLRFFLCLFKWFPAFLKDLKSPARLLNRYSRGMVETLKNDG
jgi:hypothetical protein